MLSDKQREALKTMEVGYPVLWKAHAGGKKAAEISIRSEASQILTGMLKEIEQDQGGKWPWKYWTKQAICAQALLEAGGNEAAAFLGLRPALGNIKALTFTRNEGGRRVPLSVSEQQEALRRQISSVRSYVEPILEGGDFKQDKKRDIPEKKDDRHPWIIFIRDDVRPFLKQRAADGHEMDAWGLRQAEYGAKMLKQGIPLEALKHAATMHFPPEARRELKVKDYDVTKFRKNERVDGKHAALPYCMAVVEARVPLALVGEKGTGKTTLAGHIAEILELDFGMVSMTSGTSPSAFNGRPKIGGDGGVVQSQWERIYRNGGVFLLDEMDAADENLLLLVNAALANGRFANAATGEIVEQHPDFIPVAGMNTLGLGAGRDYNSRNKLDAATLDRWNMGRVRIELDEAVEDAIFASIMGGDESNEREDVTS